MRGDTHVRFGGRARETDPGQPGHRARARPNRSDTAVIVPECRSTPITAGHGRTRHCGTPQGTSCFAVLVDHVPATAQAARTVRVSCGVTSPGKTDQSEGHRPLDGAACRIARLTHAYDLARIGEGLLDSPPRRITGHQIFRGRFQIGGDQWKPITTIVTSPGPRLVAANQNDPHGSAAKRFVPEQTRSVICTASVRPYRRTWLARQVFVVVARAATSAGVPSRAPRVRGRPERPARDGAARAAPR